MQSRDRHPDIALKSRKRRPLSEEESLARSRWPKVTLCRNKKFYVESKDIGESLLRLNGSSTAIDKRDSSVIAYDIVELLYDNNDASQALKERETYSRISGSDKIDNNDNNDNVDDNEDDDNDAYSSCKDCVECQLQDNVANDERKEEHSNYYKGGTSFTSDTSTRHEAPILVDLTRDESKATWKQTILKRFGDTKNSEMSEPRIMIADSSSRLQRSGAATSLATALRDRGPCVIPVQPNRSLPIRPAPPAPTRSTSIVTSRKTCSPILKLCKPVSLNVLELQPEKSLSGLSTNEQGNDTMLAKQLIDHTDYILPNKTNVVQIINEVDSFKRRNSEDWDKEQKIARDVKKRRKSHEVDTGRMRDDRMESILNEYSRSCSSDLTSKIERRSQHAILELWDDKRCPSSLVVSTTESDIERTKEICTKVVPPLRLKKIVREANSTDECCNVVINTRSEKESNYRIVTGATPRPESPSGYSSASLWNNVNSEKEPSDTPMARDKTRSFSPKSDGYKIKCRRNRLRQKLRELHNKASELSREMAVRNNADTSPQRSTRLRQMMNCYEKQIENITKLLCKLTASIPPTDVVDLDYESGVERGRVERADDEDDGARVNGGDGSVPPSPSPEPPKLSPRSPIDYDKGKSPDEMRNSPPVLPRVYVAIQPTLECLAQNRISNKNRQKGDGTSSGSSSSSIENMVKINDIDRTITTDDIAQPVASLVSSSEFDGRSKNDSTQWHGEETMPKLPTLKDLRVEEKILENSKILDDAEERRPATPSASSSTIFRTGATTDIELDEDDAKDTKESTDQEQRDRVTNGSEVVRSKKVLCKAQEYEKKSNLPSNHSIIETSGGKTSEYESYDSGDKINGEDGTVAGISTAAQENQSTAATTIAARQPQVSSNASNILQLSSSNYYGSSVARDNGEFAGVIQNSRNIQTATSNSNQSVASDCPSTMPMAFTQSGSNVISSNQQCVVLPNSCNNETIQESIGQRNDGNRIMTEQFPTLGNWVARMSKKQAAIKTKTKLQSGVTLPIASTAEIARMPGLETQKVRSSVPNNITRSNIVNVAPQWNTERWQRQQHQQHHQQSYVSTSSVASPVRPGICPPISVAQFYPSNYTIDPYGGASLGYHPAMYSYGLPGDYTYHSRLHATPSINGYQIPLRDPHASTLRQMPHVDKRFPLHLQEPTRHFTTDLLKYPGVSVSTGSYQHTSNLDLDRLRTASATQTGAAPACLPSLLLPPPSPLAAAAASTQQSLVRASLAGYPPNAGQCNRNRMIPDVVAAAAAAAVVAAASFGRQRGPLPSYGRTDSEIVSGSINGIIDNESPQLAMSNKPVNRSERLSEQVQSTVTGPIDSRLSNSGYRQLHNLILDRLPYMKTDDAYSQPTIFRDNAQETAVSAAPASTYKSASISSSATLVADKSARKDSRNCETPNLGKVNHTLETTSNLECSNCGLIGSMFKCLGCEAAFYCDERCQTRHWNVHVVKCPKRMPKLKKLI